METIAIGGQKGGGGKTPYAANLAFTFVRRPDTRVLLVDLDSQASLSEYLLGNETYDKEFTIYNAIMELRHIPPIRLKKNLHFFNAHDELFEADYRLFGMSNPDGRLKTVLKQYEQDYDFCVIDCPPNLGLLARNALGAAQQVLIPSKPEISHFRTLKRLHTTLDDVRRSGLNPDLAVWWIVVTQYEPTTGHHQDILETIKAAYKEKVYPEISHKTTKYSDANLMKTDVSTLDKNLGHFWDRLAATHPALKQEVTTNG
jgi:chromosome partitioning protein